MKLSNLNRIALFNIAGASYNYLAQDFDGTVKAYISKPLHDEEDWYPNYLIHGEKEFIFATPHLFEVGATVQDCSNWRSGRINIPGWKDELYKRGE